MRRMTATTILCFGDSNTWGFIPGSDCERYAPDVRWPGVMAADLGPGYRVVEEAQNGRMTAWELVQFFADLNHVVHPGGRMEALFHALELWDDRHVLAAAYSRGMRQKLSLIRALIHTPDLLILDEPVSGLDPFGIRQVRAVIEAHRAQGGAVLISSHILSEVERSANRIGILHHGHLLVEDSINGIRARIGNTNVVHIELLAPRPAPGHPRSAKNRNTRYSADCASCQRTRCPPRYFPGCGGSRRGACYHADGRDES